MERRKALILSVVATLMVFALVGMAASLVKMTLDSDDRALPSPIVTTAGGEASSSTAAGPDSTPAPLDPVVSYLDVYEVVPGSVAVGSAGAGTPSSSPGAASPSNSPATAGGAPTVPSATPVSPSPVPVTPNPSPPAPTTTSPPAPTTTVAPRPPGVPSDWPAGKPIPPMPAGCREPQLEDNGVWNCQH